MSYRYFALGNSLTLHGCCEYWWNNIGMAATVPEKDYVSLVSAYLKQTCGETQTERYNFADWERAEDRDPMLGVLEPFLAKTPDLITVQLGENVPGGLQASMEKDYCSLLRFLRTRAPQAKVIVIGDFWDETRDRIRSTAAKNTGCSFVDLTPFRGDPKYLCGTGTTVYDADGGAHTVEHPGVAAHPGDVGMAAIADAVIQAFCGDAAVNG